MKHLIALLLLVLFIGCKQNQSPSTSPKSLLPPNKVNTDTGTTTSVVPKPTPLPVVKVKAIIMAMTDDKRVQTDSSFAASYGVYWEAANNDSLSVKLSNIYLNKALPLSFNLRLTSPLYVCGNANETNYIFTANKAKSIASSKNKFNFNNCIDCLFRLRISGDAALADNIATITEQLRFEFVFTQKNGETLPSIRREVWQFINPTFTPNQSLLPQVSLSEFISYGRFAHSIASGDVLLLKFKVSPNDITKGTLLYSEDFDAYSNNTKKSHEKTWHWEFISHNTLRIKDDNGQVEEIPIHIEYDPDNNDVPYMFFDFQGKQFQSVDMWPC